MKFDALSVKLAELMETETDLLGTICNEEEKLQKALRNNNWEEMEMIIHRLNPLSEAMENAEEERNRVYLELKTGLHKKKDDGFYAIAMCMQGEIRERCLVGYRKMKIALLKMQGITAGIDQYVRIVGETSRTVLEEVFPYRKGRIYSNTGSEKPVQSDPMIVNRHL